MVKQGIEQLLCLPGFGLAKKVVIFAVVRSHLWIEFFFFHRFLPNDQYVPIMEICFSHLILLYFNRPARNRERSGHQICLLRVFLRNHWARFKQETIRALYTDCISYFMVYKITRPGPFGNIKISVVIFLWTMFARTMTQSVFSKKASELMLVVIIN